MSGAILSIDALLLAARDWSCGSRSHEFSVLIWDLVVARFGLQEREKLDS